MTVRLEKIDGEKTVEPVETIQLGGPGEGNITYFGSSLTEGEKHLLIDVLRNSIDVLNFSMNDMSGIPEYLSCYKIDILPGFKPVKQKARRLKPELTTRVLEEFDRLYTARIIRPVEYSHWLSNMVVVPKKNGKLRVYIDFTDINKTFPEYDYLIPRVDDLVMRTAGFELLSFMADMRDTIRYP